MPTKGKILVDEIDIFKNMHEWRANLTLIPQNGFILDDTIKNNITFGETNLNIEKIKIINDSTLNFKIYEIFDNFNKVKLIIDFKTLQYLGYRKGNNFINMKKINIYHKYIPSIKEIFESLGIISGLAERDKGFRDVITNASNKGVSIGPPAEREYAVDPVAVEIINPSALLL